MEEQTSCDYIPVFSGWAKLNGTNAVSFVARFREFW